MDLNAIIRCAQADNIIIQVKASDLRDLLDGAMAFAMKTIRERDEPEYYTREELARVLHVSLPTIYEYRKKGMLPEPVKIGDRVLFDKAKIREAISNGQVRVKQVFK